MYEGTWEEKPDGVANFSDYAEIEE